MTFPEIVSFGCRLNMAEGEAIRQAANGAGDLIVFNTCAVTAEAERQARQAIRKAARDFPEKRIIVTGCGAEVSRARFEAMAEVAGVVGNLVKGQNGSFSKFLSGSSQAEAADAAALPNTPNSLAPNGLFSPQSLALSGLDHVRAFVEVQNGCDHDCTFCVTTLARGESRSHPAGAVIDAIKVAVDRGQKEVVLTAVDLTSYGGDLPGKPTLGLLVERILRAVPELQRLRLSSLDCIEIDDRLFDLIVSERRVMPHLHLSLQSGDDMILKRMKRRHARGEAVALVERIKARRPEITIGADLIAGFPTEDDAMFANTLALMDDADIVLTHIFPYSPRPGTAAARMPQLGKSIAKKRAARLRGRAAERKARWLRSMVGSTESVLVERGGIGHAPNFATVRLPNSLSPQSLEGQMGVGQIVQLRIAGSDGQTLLGALA